MGVRNAVLWIIILLVCVPKLLKIDQSTFRQYLAATVDQNIGMTERSGGSVGESNDGQHFLEHNFFHRAMRGDFPNATDLFPVKVMMEYIRTHSHQQLLKEWEACRHDRFCEAFQDRKYVVAYYSCPMEAGNRLYRFLNAMLLAIATNRTLLWDYYTQPICLRDDIHTEFFDETRCYSLNNLTHCDQVLIRDPWLPSFQYWQPLLGLDEQGQLFHTGYDEGPQKGFNTDYDADDRPRLYRIGKMINAKTFFDLAGTTNSILQKDINQQRIKDLMKYGHYFAAGLLFETVFSIQPYLLPEPRQYSNVTLYVHSRHVFASDDGGNIDTDLNCLRRIFPENFTKPCTIFLMSDRQRTLDLLHNISSDEFHCEPIIANHSSTIVSGNYSDHEHGVFRGAGFFQDWALARNARTAGVAYQNSARRVLRTSSALVQSSIDFRRILELGGKDIPYFPVCDNRKGRYRNFEV